MARFDQRGAKGYGKGKNGYSSSGLSRAAHEEVSRTLVRILRYEASKYSLVISPEGWVSLDDLMQKCKGQIKNSPDEVLSVALDSEGSQGKRFEVDASKQWIKARYKHGPGQSGKGKGRGKGDKGDKAMKMQAGRTTRTSRILTTMELRMEEIMAMEKIRMVEILMEEMDRSTPGTTGRVRVEKIPG